MRRVDLTWTVFAAAFAVAGCKTDKAAAPKGDAPGTKDPAAKPATPALSAVAPAPPPAPAKEADHITVQHILVAFQGSLPKETVTRTKEEASQLAADLLRRAKAGEDFDALVRKHTDDAHPGIYKMANNGVAGNRAAGEYERRGMVPAFGDTGFPLPVGGVGMAVHDPVKSPFGWHIVKRIE